MSTQFNASPEHSIGVEIELGIIDKDTHELAPHAMEIMAAVPEKYTESIKPEFMQGYLEFNTGVCRTVDDARRDLQEKLRWGYAKAEEFNATFLWSGTHPTSRDRKSVV